MSDRTFEVVCGHCGRFICGLITPLPEPTEENTATVASKVFAGESGIHLFGIQRFKAGERDVGCDNCIGVHGGGELTFKVAKRKVKELEAEVEKLRKDGRTNAICCDQFEEALEDGQIYRKYGTWVMKIEPGEAPPGEFEKKFADTALKVVEEEFGKTKGAEFLMAWCPFCKQRF